MQDTEDAGDDRLRPDFNTSTGVRLQPSGGSKGNEQASLAQMSRMEAWALSVERRSMELTRTNRTLRLASEQHKKDAEFFRAKAERQGELLGKAEAARMEAEADRTRVEAKYARTDKGAAMLKAARLKLELEASRKKLAQLERQAKEGAGILRDNPDHLSAIESLVMEGSELRLQLDSAQQGYSSALAALHAAADARAAEKDKQIATLTSDLSSRQLLQQAAEERAADQQKQATALQQRLEQAIIAMQQAESQAGEVQKERLAWAHEREELHRGLESARASCSEQVQKLLGLEESAKAQALHMQQLQLDVQHQCDEAAHAQHEAQRMAEQAAGLRQELHEAHAKVEQQATELGAVHQRAQALEEEASQVTEKYTALSLQKADAERQQDMHAEHAHIFRDQSAAQAQQIMSLTEQLRLAQQECSSVHQSLHVKDVELREVQLERSELAQARQVLEQELSVARRSMTALEADLAMLQQDVLQLSTENTSMHIHLEDSQAAAEKLREQLATTQQTARRDSAESRSQIRRLTNEKEELESRAQTLYSRLASMQQEYEALQRRVQQQDEENDQLQELHGARSDALGKHLDLMRAEKASLAAELAEARSECLELQAELEHLHQRCTAAEGSTDAISRASEEVRAALEADVESLRSQLIDAAVSTQKMGVLEAEVASLQEQCQRLQHDKLQVEANMQAGIDELSAAHAATLHVLNERLDGASQSFVQLEEQVKSGQGELAEMEARARELHRDVQVAQSEADALRMELAEAQTSEASLRSTLNDTEGQVAAREEELDACQQRLAASKAEVREVKELLQASLQPRIAMEPMPRLISLASAAADMGCIVTAEELRKPLPQGTAQQQLAGIARDLTLSTWQGRLAAEEAQHSTPAAQQFPIATRQSREGAAVPGKQQSRTETCSTSPSKKSKVKRSTAVSLSPRGAAAVNDRENADSTSNRVLSGPKPEHGRLLWKVQRSPSPLDVRCLGSLHSAPSTPLSPTNASVAPTRRLPHSERADSGAYAKDRSRTPERPSIDSVTVEVQGSLSVRASPRSPQLLAHGALMTCR